MRIEKPVLEARLVRRYKRFLADVELEDGRVLTVHCPNPGRMIGCDAPGSRVVLRDSQDERRKLRYTFQTIEVEGTWINVDTMLPNVLVAEAIAAGAIPELAGYAQLRREVEYGLESRVDILLEDEARGRCWVEIKNTTLAEGATARFPDAVTKRGKKHAEELARMARRGDRAVAFFLVSRADVACFAPADRIDPEYAAALRAAAKDGVEVLAYSTRVAPDRFELGDALVVEL